ncbi:UNKNOWN [Stylonychia lemnae]|uniref:Uncharacterized protein n=1 Tax=Stylonychia lemnae TaxID=5949 RepID=A0A078A6G6_STYLE|nr:UNKNOWN [Stylonychia lemnae]|eukprot:CDW77170.1 UNKNOWN [Stylonychia lemnae]
MQLSNNKAKQDIEMDVLDKGLIQQVYQENQQIISQTENLLAHQQAIPNFQSPTQIIRNVECMHIDKQSLRINEQDHQDTTEKLAVSKGVNAYKTQNEEEKQLLGYNKIISISSPDQSNLNESISCNLNDSSILVPLRTEFKRFCQRQQSPMKFAQSTLQKPLAVFTLHI